MAVIAPTISTTTNGDMLATWTAVAETDTFASYDIRRSFKSLTALIGGTFGSATVVVQGSLDDTTFAGLADGTGTAISVTAAAIKEVASNAIYIKPVASGGTAQSLTVQLLIRR